MATEWNRNFCSWIDGKGLIVLPKEAEAPKLVDAFFCTDGWVQHGNPEPHSVKYRRGPWKRDWERLLFGLAPKELLSNRINESSVRLDVPMVLTAVWRPAGDTTDLAIALHAFAKHPSGSFGVWWQQAMGVVKEEEILNRHKRGVAAILDHINQKMTDFRDYLRRAVNNSELEWSWRVPE